MRRILGLRRTVNACSSLDGIKFPHSLVKEIGITWKVAIRATLMSWRYHSSDRWTDYHRKAPVMRTPFAKNL